MTKRNVFKNCFRIELFLLLTLFVCPCKGAATVIQFVDPNLATVVRDTLKIAEPNSSDMLRLTVLNGRLCGISNLSGLEYAENLLIIDVDKNNISDLRPLSKLSKLEHLNISCNKIESLEPLILLDQLKYLDASWNKIVDISPLKNLTKHLCKIHNYLLNNDLWRYFSCNLLHLGYYVSIL